MMVEKVDESQQSVPPHILMIPSFYPTKENPLNGIFFQEQALMIKSMNIDLGVIYPEIRPLKNFHPKLMIDNYFQTSFAMEKGLPTCRMHGWNPAPGYLKGTMNYWSHVASLLFKKYTQRYGRPHLVHAQSALWAGIAAHSLYNKYRIPYVITEHRDNFLHEDLFPGQPKKDWLHKILKEVFNKAKNVAVVSKALKQGLAKYMNKSNHSIEVIPNFLDADAFRPKTVAKPKDSFVFLTVAHLVQSKNIDLLLYAFQKLIKIDPKIRLRIVGNGPERKKLVTLARELSLGTHVEFLGEISRQQVKEAYADSHVFVLPSKYETFGIVYIEALSMGLPVIATRCGGPEDIITEAVGMLIPTDDQQALMNAMLAIKDNYLNYHSHHLRNYAVAKFGKETVVDHIANFYARSFYSGV
jgi:glycosyltransferase involved in cell wall biosynthesis